MSNEQVPQNNDVIADQLDELKQIELEGYELAVKKARTALFVTAALIFVWEMIGMYRDLGTIDPIVVTIAVVISGVFVALGFWTKKKPYTALIAGICAFFGYILLAVVINGMVDGGEGVFKALISGIIVKVVILVNLFRPIKDAKELQQARQQQ